MSFIVDKRNFVGILLMLKRNPYGLRHLNQNERSIDVYGKKV